VNRHHVVFGVLKILSKNKKLLFFFSTIQYQIKHTFPDDISVVVSYLFK